MKTILKTYSAVLFISACLIITTQHSFGEPDAPEAAIVSTVAAFHKALEAGEPEKVMALLAPEALIIESGYIQTRNDYQREHLTEDIAYARTVPESSRKIATMRQAGNVAWVTMTFRVVGEFHKKPVDSTSAETVVLTKTAEGWRICTIHWSSHSTPPKEASDHS